MRNLILALMRIKDDFINQKLMMSLYAVGSIVCILVFTYFFANIQILIEKYYDASDGVRTYTIFLNEDTEIKPTDFDRLSNYNIKSISITTYEITEDGWFHKSYDVLAEDYKICKSQVITLVLKNTFSDYEKSEFIADVSNKLGEIYNIDNINPPGEDSNVIASDIMKEIVKISTLYIICFIACAYLFKYVFDSNRYENTIYSLVGASKRRVVTIMLIEAGILSLASSIVTVIIHRLLLNTEFFIQLNQEGIVYSMIDYLIIIGFTLVLSILTIIPFFITYLANPLIKTKRENT